LKSGIQVCGSPNTVPQSPEKPAWLDHEASSNHDTLITDVYVRASDEFGDLILVFFAE
jgi:hypothetical protein